MIKHLLNMALYNLPLDAISRDLTYGNYLEHSMRLHVPAVSKDAYTLLTIIFNYSLQTDIGGKS